MDRPSEFGIERAMRIITAALARRPKAAALVLLISLCLTLGCGSGTERRWVGSWGAAVHSIDPGRVIEDTTLRQVMPLSIGGDLIRVRLSNALGTEPVRITAASIAISANGGDSIDPSSLRGIEYNGSQTIDIAPGEEVLSDPIDLVLGPLQEVAVSLYFSDRVTIKSLHTIALRPAFTGGGDQTSSERLSVGSTVGSWYVVSALEVSTTAQPRAVVTLGDSITDGFGAREIGGSWPERLAVLLDGETAVVNAGISGNRVLREGNLPFGPSAQNRFERDVLQQSGATTLVILEGINDLQAPAVPNIFGDDPPSPLVSSQDLIDGIRDLVDRAHSAGLSVVGGTILPYPALDALIPDGEATRAAVNDWIRNSGTFDAVIDFDAAVQDPDLPTQMLAEYDSGDGLHPGDAGYARMAEAAREVIVALP